jgi:hypothetical protein
MNPCAHAAISSIKRNTRIVSDPSSDYCTPLSKRIMPLVDDFDLDGIQKLADELDAF